MLDIGENGGTRMASDILFSRPGSHGRTSVLCYSQVLSRPLASGLVRTSLDNVPKGCEYIRNGPIFEVSYPSLNPSNSLDLMNAALMKGT